MSTAGCTWAGKASASRPPTWAACRPGELAQPESASAAVNGPTQSASDNGIRRNQPMTNAFTDAPGPDNHEPVNAPITPAPPRATAAPRQRSGCRVRTGAMQAALIGQITVLVQHLGGKRGASVKGVNRS